MNYDYLSNTSMKKLLVILGPTATGKTDLAIKLAKKFNGELVSADSRQVYKKLDIGTGKLPGKFKSLKKEKKKWVIDGVSVYMYDMISPDKQYTVANYVKDANQAVEDVIKRGKLPIIVGGSGLYIRALVDGLSNLNIPFDKKLRKELEKLDRLSLQEKLKLTSFKKWATMNYSDRQNPRRLIRAIELASVKVEIRKTKKYNVFKIGLNASREILYQRADERVVSRINQGMIEEVRSLRARGLTLKRLQQLGLEYGVLAEYLKGKIKTEKDLIRILQFRIHDYIRRQLTWFKKEKNVQWFDIEKKIYIEVEKLARQWYHSNDGSQN